MAWTVDASRHPLSGLPYEREATIVLVGCGGTGAFVADVVCRLLLGREARLYLVDMDRAEERNARRQAFTRTDIGRFKAEVVAERLARRFGREVGYAVQPYCRDLHASVFDDHRSRLNLLLGCVDNGAARRAIADTLRADYGRRGIWWLDAGNERNSGQVLLGNALDAEALRGAFRDGVCRALPAPSFQRPDLLSAPAPRPVADCAQAVADGEQGGTINLLMAALVAGYVERLLAGTCRWMATYVDADAGALRCVPAEPRAVAQVAGLHPNAVAPPAARA